MDVAGECSAYYAVYGGKITKTKQNCQNVEIAGEHENVNKVKKKTKPYLLEYYLFLKGWKTMNLCALFFNLFF